MVRRGVVKQVTPRLIAIQGERYPETILANDLLLGEVIVKKDGERVRVKKKARKSAPSRPPEKKLAELWRKHGKVGPISRELKTSWYWAKKWLEEAGIMEKKEKQVPETESVQVEGPEPKQSKPKPADESVAQENKLENETPFLKTQTQSSLAPIKMKLIAVILCEYSDNKIPADAALELVDVISDMAVVGYDGYL